MLALRPCLCNKSASGNLLQGFVIKKLLMPEPGMSLGLSCEGTPTVALGHLLLDFCSWTSLLLQFYFCFGLLYSVLSALCF